MTTLAYGALWIFVFTIPWQFVLVILPGVGLLSKLTGGLALGAALGVALISGRVRRWYLFHVAALFFVGWLAYLLSAVATSQDVPKTFWTFIQLFLVLWIMWELAPSWDRLMGLFTAYVIGAHVAAFGTILTYLRSAGALRRYAAGGVDANDLAMTLALALPMAWYLGMTLRKPLLRWVCRAYLVIGLLAVALTGSRSGMLTTAVGLLIVPVTMLRLAPSKRAAAVALLIIGGVITVAYVPEQIVERLSTTSSEIETGRLSGRGALWRAGLRAFAAKPVTGYGPGGFRGAVFQYMGPATQVAHNSYISVLVEEGLVGFFFYMTMIGSVWVAVLKLPLLERRFALVLLTTLAVAMLPLTWEDRRQVWFVLAAVLGLAKAARPALAGAPGVVFSQRAVPVAFTSRATRPRDPTLPVAPNAGSATAS
jgi:O-antigen ligase